MWGLKFFSYNSAKTELNKKSFYTCEIKKSYFIKRKLGFLRQV